MGTIQEAGEETVDLGIREKAETAILGASLRLGELELKEEWQDEEFPRLLPEETGPSEDPHDPGRDTQAGTPSTLALCGRRPMRKRLSAPELRLNLTKGPGDDGASPTHSGPSSSDGSSDLEVDELETPSDSELLDSGHEFEWEDELPRAEGLGASEAAERLGRGCMWDVAGEDGHRWRVFRTAQREQRVDMTVIEPYKKVLSHGGYHGDGLNAVILFASCYLPRSSIPNYTYVMEHLFRYIVGTLELLVAENYLLVHLSGGTSRAQVPPLSWIRQCYHTLDRRYEGGRRVGWSHVLLQAPEKPSRSGGCPCYMVHEGIPGIASALHQLQVHTKDPFPEQPWRAGPTHLHGSGPHPRSCQTAGPRSPWLRKNLA